MTSDSNNIFELVRVAGDFSTIAPRPTAPARSARPTLHVVESIDAAALERDAQALVNEFCDTDLANTQRFARRHASDVRFTADGGWMVYEGRRWVMDEKDVRVTGLAKETVLSIYDEIRTAHDKDEVFEWARRSQSRQRIDAIVSLARSEPGVLARVTDFDPDPMLLNVLSGTIDLRTGTIRTHDRKDLISRIAPVEYDPDAVCERWDKFVARITGGNQELYEYLRRVVGYMLTGCVDEQVLHFLHGGGANGKSVFCEVLLALLGDYAVVLCSDVLTLKRHGGIPNDLARLRGARAVFMNETTQGSRFDEAKLKDLTGADTLTARFLHREFFDFKPTHKLLIRGNHKPGIVGMDDGIWRRLRLVPFVVQIPPEEQDRQLTAKLRNELSGILNWAIQGCLEWQRDGLRPPALIMEAVQQYRAESDTLGKFIAERCSEKASGTIRSSHFYRAYQEFAERMGERALASKDLPAEMSRRGFSQKRNSGGMVYLGLELANEQGDWPGM